MIIGEKAVPVLHVEGVNDMHVIGALMKSQGHELYPDRGPVIIQPHKSCTALLKSFTSSVKSAQGLDCSVGFVIDMDRLEDNRVEQVRARLRELGSDLTEDDLNDNGVIKRIGAIKVGVWFMPSASAPSGKLENFLRGMVPSDDMILPISDSFVKTVGETVPAEKRFRDIDVEKAQMHAWLAVQPDPGLPYGSAINASYLSSSNPGAKLFVSWMCRLFDLT